VRGLKALALKLHDLGFNVIPVGPDKKPLCKWSSRERLSREELERLLSRATGVGVIGGPVNPFKPVAVLALVDIDKPSALDKYPGLKSLVESTVSWYTGPRCPSCEEKHLEVLEPGKKFKCKCGREFTIKEVKRGIAALVTIEPSTAKQYLSGTVRGRDVELLVNNYQLIPPSLHPSGVKYEWIKPFDFEAPNLGVRALVDTELTNLLEELGVLKPETLGNEERVEEEKALEKELAETPLPRLRELKTLSDSEIIELKELLREVYKPGIRQYIWLFLSGWAAKANISPVSIAKVLKMLYEETGDTDSLKTRAAALVYSYKKMGVDLSPYYQELEEIFGVKPYGLEKEISEEQVKGKTGLQEIIEDIVSEERALEIIREIEEIFRAGSPFRDSVIEIMDYEKQIYAVANLRKLVVVRARRESSRLVYKEKILNGAPTEVVVYVNPVGGVTKYRVKWESPTRPRPLVIGPATIEDIIGRLKLEGLVVCSRLVSDVLTAVFEGFIKKGRAVIREELDRPGFYWVENKLVVVGVDVKEPSMSELRKALELLNELAENWYRHVIDRFATTIKWGVIASFIFPMKQRGKWVPWLYLYGASGAGKTTLGKIVLAIQGLRVDKEEHVKSGARIDSPARLGELLSQSTLPFLVIEPGNALAKEEVVEMLKSAIETTLARGRFSRGIFEEIPALAPLIFTSNRVAPRDDALLRRLVILRFTFGEVVPQSRVREFEEKIKPNLLRLAPIGQYTASRVLADPSILSGEWLEVAEKLLSEAYASVGLQPPEWIKLSVSTSAREEFYKDLAEAIRVRLLDKINEAYFKSISRIVAEKSNGVEFIERADLDLKERINIVLNKRLISWLIPHITRRGEELVIITTGILQELRDIVGDIGGLKSLAELLGWSYEDSYSFRESGRVRSLCAILTPRNEFIEFLVPEPYQEQEKEEQEGSEESEQSRSEEGQH